MIRSLRGRERQIRPHKRVLRQRIVPGYGGVDVAVLLSVSVYSKTSLSSTGQLTRLHQRSVNKRPAEKDP